MHKNAMKCNKTLSKWCKNKHGASKIIDTLETYQKGLDKIISVFLCNLSKFSILLANSAKLHHYLGCTRRRIHSFLYISPCEERWTGLCLVLITLSIMMGMGILGSSHTCFVETNTFLHGNGEKTSILFDFKCILHNKHTMI
jgi:hypothetical protein